MKGYRRRGLRSSHRCPPIERLLARAVLLQQARLMPRLTLDLHADEIAALRKAAESELAQSPEDLAAILLRDALVAGGWLEDAYQIDEDTKTAGEA